MEILVIIGIAVLVGAVVLYRKKNGSRPNAPESPGNDGE
ncbi:LPXTG cell wall anchor domain-containing protein [Nocardia iowensis]|uniref:LPXTG cell wall anchor domain-containing protein n=1 Tax=Nocardia iowensis TaxID=204891 RepID=A0ABX8RNE2_NOCIO|nr:LPXTG cell wall anchor domain-containing protein [Nocardia iowensis]QXN88921.1 LPXTG cell wall anchor domain-containing protein [Nocardia iowensis]